jgi:hypothetical protein
MDRLMLLALPETIKSTPPTSTLLATRLSLLHLEVEMATSILEAVMLIGRPVAPALQSLPTPEDGKLR